MSAAERFARVIGSLQRGEVARAQALCAEILEQDPTHADAMHVLGILALQRGEAGTGVGWLRKSLAANPRQAMVYCNLGNGLRDVNEPDAAVAAYRRALELDPKFAGAKYGMGNAFLDLKQPAEALASFDQAIALQPAYAEAHNNRGNVLVQTGRLDEALESFRRACECNPHFSLAIENRAAVLMRLSRPEESLEFWNRLIALRPQEASAFANRAHCLMILQRIDEALRDFDAALRLKPDSPETLFGRGTALRSVKRHREALLDFERAHLLIPQSPDVLFRKAEALRDLQRPVEAALAFAQVLNLAPDRDYALGNLLQARLQTCDWTDYGETVGRVLAAVADGRRACLPGPLFAISDSASLQLTCARAFSEGRKAVVPPALWTGERYGHEKIRVAYVSADFRDHPVSVLLAGVLEQHAKDRFEIIGVSLAPDDGSTLGQRIRAAFDQRIDVAGKTDAEAAAMMRALEIDIAVDLMGFTGGNRSAIFAHRPAPAQVSYLGFTGTLASSTIDYVIADRVVIPPDDIFHFSESVVHLPECYQPGDSERLISARMPTRAECGLPEHSLVFCCFNTHYKISPEVFRIWMRLLDAVPGSVLWLSKASPECMANLCREARAHGIDSGRLVFATRLSAAEDYLARLKCADLFLDTFPFNAHVTASDALWAGLPVLTCSGRSFAARVASSLLTALDLPDLITTSLAGYEASALRLGTTPGLLAQLRSRLESNRLSRPLFQTERYCRHLEAAYSVMHDRVTHGMPPAAFSIAPLPR